MKVLLRYSLLRTYYGGRYFTVADPKRAMNLGTIERAAQFAKAQGLAAMEIVVSFDDPVCELVLPLAGNRTGGVKAAPALRPAGSVRATP